MDVTTALLRDDAQVRDGLLFVLSAGITRLHRESFPAASGVCFALVVEFEQAEAGRSHDLAVVMVDEDGREVVRFEAGVQVRVPESLKPGESLLLPLALYMRGAVLRRTGAYELGVYIGGDP